MPQRVKKLISVLWEKNLKWRPGRRFYLSPSNPDVWMVARIPVNNHNFGVCVEGSQSGMTRDFNRTDILYVKDLP